ncbi:MAG: hypothetical protein FWD57_05450 [Polyangiaceae bacterium]|nr:hypothetical protein [Polyangiaceae bacterium]
MTCGLFELPLRRRVVGTLLKCFRRLRMDGSPILGGVFGCQLRGGWVVGSSENPIFAALIGVLWLFCGVEEAGILSLVVWEKWMGVKKLVDSGSKNWDSA